MLLRNVLITDPASTHHGSVRDVRVQEGHIQSIGSGLQAEADEEVFERPAARLSPGFVDIGAYLGDPGHEEREDVASLRAAARAGGYVAVAVLPTTRPVRQSVADMTYLSSYNTGDQAVDLLPLAALSHDAAGKDLTEMMELAGAGALAFTDGPHRAASGNLLKRGLQYARAFGGLIMDTPYARALAEDGQMHEGAVSVQLGLPGIPTLCETVPLNRALSLLDYTEGRLLVHLVSSAEGLQAIIRHRREATGALGCTVSAHHLTFTDRDLLSFDPNLKVLPPLRAESDRAALRQGLRDGTVDAIVSHHRARHGEEKDLEFSYAAFGARGLETTLRQLLPLATEHDLLDAIITALTTGPRRLLALPELTIEEGAAAALTVFTTEGESTITGADLRGKTRNNPLLGHSLPGRMLATINHGRLWTLA